MRILFVCMGNICRSPSAVGMFQHHLDRHPKLGAVQLDSAGTHGYHIGEPPDHRAIAAARRRGIDLSRLRARQVQLVDFERFDLLLAMDRENLVALKGMAPQNCPCGRVRLLLDFAPECGMSDVPDPYYGDEAGFEKVLDLLEEASIGLLQHVYQSLGQDAG